MNIKISEDENNYCTRDLINLDNNKKTMLPHGSGIDSDWIVKEKGNKYICYNSFHCMNDVGFYDGWVDFSVTINKQTGDTKVRFHADGAGWYRVRKYNLRDYLEDLFAMMMTEVE